MAMNNRERIGRAFDLLSEGLLDAVDPVMTQAFDTSDWPADGLQRTPPNTAAPYAQ